MLDLIKILSRRDVLATLLAVSIWGIDGAAAQAPDPLPSWGRRAEAGDHRFCGADGDGGGATLFRR